MNDDLTPDEQNLVELLSNAPKPKLTPRLREDIRQTMLREFRTVASVGSAPSIIARPPIPVGLLTAVAAVVLVVIVGTVVLTGDDERPDGAALVSGTPDAATQVADAASATPAASATTEAPAVQSTAEATPNTVTADDTLTPITATDAPVAPGPTPTLAASVMIEGPITAITENVVTVFDLEIALEPQHPLLNLLNVGDIIRVEGNLNADGMILASIVSNIPGGTAAEATVGLEGPVESIDGNIIVINNVPVQLDADDPLLQSVQVGDFVSVEGNFEGSGTNIVLVVVDIVIVNNIIVDGSPYCWYHNDGMGMGHWHCDGMGMGMGMGDAMGMGMGD